MEFGRHKRGWSAALVLLSGMAVCSIAWAGDIPGHQNPPISVASGDWDLNFGGFIQAGGLTLLRKPPEDAASDDYFGFLDFNARLDFKLTYKDFVSAKIGFDTAGAVDTVTRKSDGKFSPKDAYVDFKLARGARVKLGRFKPPKDFESLTSETASNFIQRSLVSTGGEAFLMNNFVGSIGASPGRQIGLSLYSDMVDFGDVGLNYQVAVTNGAGEDGVVSAYGRFEFALMNALYDEISPGYFLSFAVGADYHMLDVPKSVSRSDRRLDRYGVSGEIHARYSGLEADFGVFWLNADYFMAEEYEPDTGMDAGDAVKNNGLIGIVAQASYRLDVEYWRFQFAYRFAWLDDGHQAEERTQHTAAVGYYIENYPVVIRVEYTHNGEYYNVDNDTLAAMVQLAW